MDKARIAKQFSRAATTYDAYANLQNQMAIRLIGMIDANQTGELVDLGCGTGSAIGLIQQDPRFRSLKLTGIDLADGMVTLARQQTNARIISGDIEQIPLEDKSVQIAFSNTAVQWCDLAKVAQEVQRILRPGGQFVFSTFGPASLTQWREALQQIDRDQNRVHLFPTAEEVHTTLRRSGLEHISMDSEIQHELFSNIDDMMKSVRKIGATYAGSDRKNEYFGRKKYLILREKLNDLRDSSGNFSLSYETIFVSCKATG